MYIYIILIMLVSINSAFAQEHIQPNDPCLYAKNTIQHNQVAQADYVAGVDVHGKPVTPADVQMTREVQAFPITIPLDLDMAKRYGIDLPKYLEAKAHITAIEIFADGRVFYKGVDITKNIIDGCKAPLDRDEKIQSNQDQNLLKSDGQKPADAVVSSDKIEGQYP